jgi:hypothetical protein
MCVYGSVLEPAYVIKYVYKYLKIYIYKYMYMHIDEGSELQNSS